jgi:hypothetical protein
MTMATSTAKIRARRQSPTAPSPAPTQPLTLPDGTTAEVRGEALEIRDGEGRLMVRYCDGMAEISAPSGDLRLVAPAGRVVIQSALDVSVEAGRDVLHHAGRHVEISAATRPDGAPQLHIDHARTELRTGELHVQAQGARAVVGQVALVAHAVAATADRMAITAGEYELVAERVVTRARDSLREITDLAESRLGRVRALVRGVYSLSSRRTVMTSTDDTSIDGSRIHLG